MFLACAMVLTASAQEAVKKMVIENPWETAKQAAPVVVKLKKLKLPFEVKSAVVTLEGQEVACQLDDLDGDQRMEELVFLTDMPAKSRKEAQITLRATESSRSYTAEVYAEMLLSEKEGNHQPIRSLSVPGSSDVYNLLHHHGPAFESNLVAFRTYFDARQSVDIYGKQKRQLELKDTRFYPTPQQIADGYGDDVLWAGTTVGLGSLRGLKEGALTFIEPVELRTECIRAYGPLRTVVDIIDNGWQYGGGKLDMTARYILYAGHRDLEVQLTFARRLKKEEFATGLIRLDNPVIYNDHSGTAACWGDNWPYGPNDTIGHPKVTLGLAISIPRKFVTGEPANSQNILYTIGREGGEHLNYHLAFCSLREREGYRSADEWFGYVKALQTDVERPLNILFK